MASFTRPVASPKATAYLEWIPGAPRGTSLTPFEKIQTHLVISR